jgi:4-hydroxybenzoate polyprenyltransferase
MPSFLKLIRLPNLLIMSFTQYMIHFCVFMPINLVMKHNIDFGLFDPRAFPETDFSLLVLSTVLIGAAGYIINDYFDVRIDELNRPATNMVGKTVKRRVAIVMHTTFNVIGVMIGFWLSYKYHIFRIGAIIFITAPALLWFYSTSLKRQLLVGNLVIALLTGMVPLIAALFEKQYLVNYFTDPANDFPLYFLQRSVNSLQHEMHVALFVGLFAFLVSLLREIIKDTEDYEGDLAYGCKTLPITAGIARTKLIIAGLCAVVVAVLGWIQFDQQISSKVNVPIYVKQDVEGIRVALVDTVSSQRYEGVTSPDGTANIRVPELCTYKTEINGLAPVIVSAPEADRDWKSFFYFVFLLQLPVVYLAYRAMTAKGKKDWHFSSILVKIIMVAGVSYLFLYTYDIPALIHAFLL